SGVHYTESVLHAGLNATGLATTWRFEYGSDAPCDTATCTNSEEKSAPAGTTPVDSALPLFDLKPSTTYHARLVATNDAGTTYGPDETSTPLARVNTTGCPNAALRAGTSSSLPDCRAYELITPPDTNNLQPRAASAGTAPTFSNWLTPPTGPQTGDE